MSFGKLLNISWGQFASESGLEFGSDKQSCTAKDTSRNFYDKKYQERDMQSQQV